MVDLAILSALTLWFAGSVVYNIPRLRRFATALDVLWILPAWSFFAPTPGTSDYHWLYRDVLSDGTVTPWTELSSVCARSLLTTIINPRKRALKALVDIAAELTSSFSVEHPAASVTTLSYVTLLNAVSRAPHASRCERTQFMIMHSPGFTAELRPRMLFLSDFHRLA